MTESSATPEASSERLRAAAAQDWLLQRARAAKIGVPLLYVGLQIAFMIVDAGQALARADAPAAWSYYTWNVVGALLVAAIVWIAPRAGAAGFAGVLIHGEVVMHTMTLPAGQTPVSEAAEALIVIQIAALVTGAVLAELARRRRALLMSVGETTQ